MTTAREQKMIETLRTVSLYDNDGRLAMHITENAANLIEDLVEQRSVLEARIKSAKAGFADDMEYNAEMAASYDF